MTTQSTSRTSAPTTPARGSYSAANASLPIWVRIGVPATLALLAGVLNANTVRQQLNPIEALSLAVDVSPGMRLTADQLRTVTVGGNLDRSKLLTMQDLLATLETKDRSDESIERALAKSPQIFSRSIAGGELLTKTCLGGIEQLEAGHERVNVPVANIIGDCSSLVPGQLIYFNALSGRTNTDRDQMAEIGPFRIPFWTRKSVADEKYALLPLVYRVGPNGERSAGVQALLAAAYSERGKRLALVEKSTKTQLKPSTPSKKR